MSKPVPPKIAPKPGQVKVVQALHSYTAQKDAELSFSEGDVLYITEQKDKDWWKARCGNKTGLIPSHYVELKTDAVSNPVHDAARRGNLEFLRECLKNGVSPTGLDTAGNSPLHWSARGGYTECVQELIQAASKVFGKSKKFVSAQNKIGDTPLHYACAKSNVDIVKILLENDADPTIPNKAGETPWDLSHDAEVKTLLQNALVDPNERDVNDNGYGDGDSDYDGSDSENQ